MEPFLRSPTFGMSSANDSSAPIPTTSSDTGRTSIQAVPPPPEDSASPTPAKNKRKRLTVHDLQRIVSRLDQLTVGIVLLLTFLLASFAARNSDLWLHVATGRAIEIVSYRLAAWGLSDKPQLPAIKRTGCSLDAAVCATRPVVFGGAERQVAVFDRDRLPPGQPMSGPALIEEGGSTTLVPPGWSAELDAVGCLLMRRS